MPRRIPEGFVRAALSLLIPLGVVAHGTPLSAECVMVRFTDLKRMADFVFEGQVIKVEGRDRPQVIGTVDVSRVWKGKVTKRMTVWYEPSIDGPTLKEGGQHIFFAQISDAKTAKARGVPEGPPGAVRIPPCQGATGGNEQEVRSLGRSHPPDTDAER
jgi:hypothetical protein